MSYWSCVRTEPRREHVAEHFLQLGGFDVYVPQLRERRLRYRRQVEITAPLFPSYIFVAGP
jgi:hypothetical protein